MARKIRSRYEVPPWKRNWVNCSVAGDMRHKATPSHRKEGAKAFAETKDEGACPYLSHSQARRLWLKGYREAAWALAVVRAKAGRSTLI
jgi:ribosome modulation factor|tara:strand:+ start:509 stop:775 length:267 start_codon:yes stop_codon:yes gene_type:complete